MTSLHADRHVLNTTAFELRETMLGFKYNPASLLVHPRIQLRVASVMMYDWAHCYICDGLADVETGMFFKALSRTATHVSSIFEFGAYALQMTHPKDLSSLQEIMQPKRLEANLKNEHFSCSASQFLTLYPILRRYIANIVCSRGELPDQCRSMLLCLDALEMIHCLKGCGVTHSRLRRAIEHHLDAYIHAYGRAHARPKCHYVLHLPDMYERHGCLLSTLVNERRHRLVKRYTRDRCTVDKKWEVGALEEVVAAQCQEATEVVFFNVGMLEPRAPRPNAWRAVSDMFPDVARDDVFISRQLRTDYGTLTCGDYIFYHATAGVKVGVLETVVAVEGVVKCIISTFVVVSRAGRWMVCKADGKLVVIPAKDALCASAYMASGGEVDIHVPYFLRN